ncbi:MAG TPA: hypothetical protein VMT24_17105 [Aggregatilineaceae bacterium]|nr:hypothetical protein [Aggregatilineaceae bacterium]
MILFGTRTRLKTLGSGQFFCQAPRTYLRKSAAQDFTLYFLPVFPVRQLGELIECQTCKRTYHPDVLRRLAP